MFAVDTVMETYTGRRIDLAKPNPADICIEDIAWHLSKLPRFGGATQHETTYNVAQHSVLVLNRVRQLVPMPSKDFCITALLHDAHEAYMGDKIAPMGALLDFDAPLSRLKLRLQKAIWIGLMGEKWEPVERPEIKQADQWACSYEAYHLMHSQGRDYRHRILLDDEYILRNLIVWDSRKAYVSFKNHYNSLLP